MQQRGHHRGQKENPINVIYSYKLWDYGQTYVTLDRHSYSTAIITMSLDVFNSLDEATQEIFLTSAQEAAEYERAWVAEQEASQLETIKSHGVEVIETPETDTFRAAVQGCVRRISAVCGLHCSHSGSARRIIGSIALPFLSLEGRKFF